MMMFSQMLPFLKNSMEIIESKRVEIIVVLVIVIVVLVIVVLVIVVVVMIIVTMLSLI